MEKNDPIWDIIVDEARQASAEEPLLESYFTSAILDQPGLDTALSFNLAQQLDSAAVPAATKTLAKEFAGTLSPPSSEMQPVIVI
jgi:hypothetical protein